MVEKGGQKDRCPLVCGCVQGSYTVCACANSDVLKASEKLQGLSSARGKGAVWSCIQMVAAQWEAMGNNMGNNI